ncbi:bark storage protein A [Typha angustifolia]|uniref:bark storage protein A n=1 Tax=Typha angustifolia TaxID=59011 RepID=UPI003C309131
MMRAMMKKFVILVCLVVLMGVVTDGATPVRTLKKVWQMNKRGPFLGVIVPNSFEMNPLLNSSSFVQNKFMPHLDVGGKRFRFGSIGKEKVIVVMTGLGMLNAGLTTQLLLSLFDVKGVVHFGVAGNANPDLQIGDVTIPLYWGHTGLWYWQRYGDGAEDELALESSGDYTRKVGHLNFSDYDANRYGKSENLLNSVWYQPEEIFPENGVPEVRQHALWVPTDKHYYALAEKLKGMELQKCADANTCLERNPMVVRVEKGCSANVFVDNAAYRQFLRSNFNVSPIDMESAAVALVCLQLQTPFIAIRALSDLAGGGSALSNEANNFATLAAENAVIVALKFISFL